MTRGCQPQGGGVPQKKKKTYSPAKFPQCIWVKWKCTESENKQTNQKKTKKLGVIWKRTKKY